MDIYINLSFIEIGKIKRNCGKLDACIEGCTDSNLKSLLSDVNSALKMIEWKIDQTIMEEEGS